MAVNLNLSVAHDEAGSQKSFFGVAKLVFDSNPSITCSCLLLDMMSGTEVGQEVDRPSFDKPIIFRQACHFGRRVTSRCPRKWNVKQCVSNIIVEIGSDGDV